MKRRIPYLILGLLVVAGGAFGGYWWRIGRFIETTDNAYIRGEITPIGVKVSGYVAQVLVEDHQLVSAGDPLVQIEDLEFRVQLERGRSGLAERQAALKVAMEKQRQQQDWIDLQAARLTGAQVELQREVEEFGRLQQLYAEKIISPMAYSAAAAGVKKCRAEVDGAAAELRMARRELSVLQAEMDRITAEIEQQRQELRLQQQALADTRILAPVSGRIGNRRVRPGQYLRPGSVLMAVIPLDRIWVEANFKEVQLARMQPGQAVDISVDAFPDRKFSGRIESLSPASGAEFSLLPPENASGNFTKIVQRIPVKISIEQVEPQLLLPGMSVEVRLDTRQPGTATHDRRLAELSGE